MQYEAYTFKFTKDAEFEIEQDLRSSVIEKVSRGVKRRKRGETVRVVYDQASHPRSCVSSARWRSSTSATHVSGGGRYHNMRDLMDLPDCGRKGLRFPQAAPAADE